MTPLEFLSLMLVLTAAAAGVHFIRRRRHVERLKGLAGEANLHFTPVDRFRLAPRIAPMLGVPGAAAIRVIDLLYGAREQTSRYIFAAEYTTGVLRSKTSVRRVLSFDEPRESEGKREDARLVFAPEGLSVVEQYRFLLKDPS